MTQVTQYWDIFCRVVDNYGDIGVCWRLARQLAAEHGLQVRLWVDDLASFARICHDIDTAADTQRCRGLEVRRWSAHETAPSDRAADVIIDAFGCDLPPNYREKLASSPNAPVWINLEYLSAETWVDGCHKLASPQMDIPVPRYFFFPGFSANSGGLLCERDLLRQRRQFQQADRAGRTTMFAAGNYGEQLLPLINAGSSDELRILLFCYPNPQAFFLLNVWMSGNRPVRVLVPQGVLTQELSMFLGQSLQPGESATRCSLTVQVFPFLEQEAFDYLLWSCDFNFVRGEDSFVRAQWAAQPFVWHIYPQEENAHLEKLDAFLQRYTTELSDNAKSLLYRFSRAWNGAPADWSDLWNCMLEVAPELRLHGEPWAEKQTEHGDLAANLVLFARERAQNAASLLK